MTLDILEMMQERKNAKDKFTMIGLTMKCKGNVEAKENWIRIKCTDIEENRGKRELD